MQTIRVILGYDLEVLSAVMGPEEVYWRQRCRGLELYPQLAQKWGKPGMLWFRTVETVFCPYCLSVLLKTKIKNFFAGEPLLTFFSFSQNSWGMQQAQTVLKWASSVCLFCFLQDNYLRIWNGSFLFRYVVLSILWVGFLDPSHVSSTLARRP